MNKTPWGIDRLREDRENATKEQQEIRNKDYLAIARCFSTDTGIEALKVLKRRSTNLPTWVPGTTPDYGYYREGQNSIAGFIEEALAYIKKISN